jgi:hypothetical protein
MPKNRCEVKFVEGSGKFFEVKTFGTAEGADGMPVEVVKGTTKTTIAAAKQQLEIAEANLDRARSIFDQIKVIVKAQGVKAAEELEKETE